MTIKEEFIRAAATNLNGKLQKFLDDLPNQIETRIKKAANGDTVSPITLDFAENIPTQSVFMCPAYQALHKFCEQEDMRLIFYKKTGRVCIDIGVTYLLSKHLGSISSYDIKDLKKKFEAAPKL